MGRARGTWALHAAVIPALVITVATGCGGPGRSSGTPSAPSATASDINPVDRSRLADGGTLRWPIDALPANYNYNELDGASSECADVIGALLPQTFNFDASSQPELRTEYFQSAELSATAPKEVVRLRINPRATWDDGSPMTETDFEAQWKALRGTDPAYQVASTQGYDKIESVARGGDEREVVITFRQPFADWRSLFSPLYPASTNGRPAVFNTGWKAQPLITAGPFRVQSIDQTAQTITVVRNPRWWGRPAKLDRIIFRSIDPDAQIDALANGEIDFLDVGSDVDKLRRASTTAGITVHRAGGPNYTHLDFNGTSPFLGDLTVRRAIAMATDRATIDRALLTPLGLPATPLGNHIFMANQKGYRDNSGSVGRYDPKAAAALLDAAGWKLSGTQRVKDGRPLEVRIVIPSQVATSKQLSELLLAMLARVGVKLDIQTVPVADFFDKYINPGNFDLTAFAWGGTNFPISSAKSIYAKPTVGPGGQLQVQQNYARIGSDQIDHLFDEATAQFDENKSIALGNQIDTLIWQEVHSLTLYQRPEIIPTRSTLANFGAFGFATAVYEDIGFRRS
jgi:peptide/nickel transport system substrate-binding protein